MTISITIPGVTFTKFVSKVMLPYMESALAFNLYGGDAASSCLNRVVGSTINATVIGAPVYSPGYALCRNVNNGFDLGQLMDQPYTQIAVVQKTTGLANTPIFCRGAGNPDNFKSQLLLTGAAGLQEWPNGEGGQTAAGRNDAAFQLIGAAWKAGEKDKAFLHTGATLTESVSSVNTVQVVQAVNNLRVGSGWYDADGYFRVAATVNYSRVLTAAEILEVYAYLKPLLASRGVVI